MYAHKSVYVIGKTTDKLNKDVQKLTGVNTALFNHYIKANSIRHIARMGYVINNYDSIEALDTTSKEYRDKNQQPAPMIRLSKKIDGTFYVVEAVPDTKAKGLAVVSAYIKKAPTQQTENVRAPSLNARNASANVETSIDNIISQGSDTVNNSNMQNKDFDTKNFKLQDNGDITA